MRPKSPTVMRKRIRPARITPKPKVAVNLLPTPRALPKKRGRKIRINGQVCRIDHQQSNDGAEQSVKIINPDGKEMGKFEFRIMGNQAYSGMGHTREVVANARALGLGQLLLNETEKLAKRKGLTEVVFHTAAGTTSRLLINNGYRIKRVQTGDRFAPRTNDKISLPKEVQDVYSRRAHEDSVVRRPTILELVKKI